MRILLLVCLFLFGALHVSHAQLVANDESALKFALALKRTQLGLFSAGMQNLTMQDFINVGYNVTIYQYLNIIGSQLQQQAENISSLLTQGGATPLGDCTYNTNSNDSLVDPEAFLIESRNLCNIVVSGMSSLLSYISDNNALSLLASDHSVAGRHCAYLNLISGLLPFPSAHENSTTLQETQSALQPYIESCPYTLTIPNPRRASSSAAHVAFAAVLLVLPAVQLFAF